MDVKFFSPDLEITPSLFILMVLPLQENLTLDSYGVSSEGWTGSSVKFLLVLLHLLTEEQSHRGGNIINILHKAEKIVEEGEKFVHFLYSGKTNTTRLGTVMKHDCAIIQGLSFKIFQIWTCFDFIAKSCKNSANSKANVSENRWHFQYLKPGQILKRLYNQTGEHILSAPYPVFRFTGQMMFCTCAGILQKDFLW
ncbi:hypothetical protein DV515_00012137 [Chloebia gouldiae]|uniref:Uncharacterized protein n=1 Tax=Chloebia gouldiae TaxID=44316 RepID=A0A3L8S5N9_CHLGU|nr:hypothetical protein DV515_00012137 [Chloebia gouldiae]